MRVRILLGGLVCLVVSVTTLACGGANRATVHDEDIKKVFPWQSGKQEMTIRVKPQTTLANTCNWFGSFEEVVVTPQTTFYITDELDKKFAYTPSRSPIRRLAPVQSIEIRWPVKAPVEDQQEEVDAQKEKAPKAEEEKPPGKEAEKTPPKQP